MALQHSKIKLNAQNTVSLGKTGNRSTSSALRSLERKIQNQDDRNLQYQYQNAIKRPRKLSLPPIGKEETPEERKKRESNNDNLVDKADKQHEEDLKKGNAKTFGGLIREEAENKATSVLYMLLGEKG